MEISRARLIEAIGRVVPAISGKELFEQADKLAFKSGRIVAYNDSVSISVRLPELEGIEGAIDGRKLHDLLSRISAEAVTISVGDDGKLVVRGGRSKVSFDVSAVSLPVDEIDRSGDEVQLPPNFLDALGIVTGCCARDMSRPALTCVRMGGDAIESADGYRGARFRFLGVDLPSVLLPVTAAEIVSDYPVERVGLGEGKEWIRFSAHAGDTVVYARLLAGNYPDLSPYYVVDGGTVELPAALSDVLDRAQVFSKRDKKVDEEVSLTFKKNQILVEASCDGARFSEVVRWDGAAEVKFAIHPRSLKAALKSGTSCVIGSERVKFVGQNWETVIALQ